jgi:CHAT domain-containing protein
LLALARLTLGGEHDDAGDLEAAERELAAGVAIGQEIHDPLSIARGSALLGWVLAQRGDAAGAEAQLAAAVAAAREAGARAEEATALLYLGKARLLSGRLDDAEASLAQARTTCEALGRTEDLGQVLTAQARLSLARGDLGAATERIDGALGHFESVRTRVALADRRARYAAFRREAYDVAVAVRLARDARAPGQGHRAAAFDLTERARARSLQEELAARRGASSAVPDDLSLRHRRALDRIGHVQRKLVDGHTSAQPDERALAGLERDLAAAVASEEEVRREIRRLTPRRAPDDQAAPTAAAIAARLGRDEALLEYHVGANASWLFVVTRAGLEVATLPGARTLREQVDALRGLLAAPRTLGATQYATAGHAAYRTLVAPALEGRPHLRRLRIVPDGPLWEIPFEALLTAPARGGGYASLPYLLRRFTVSYQPSADAPARPEAAGRRAELVAFADPRLPDGARAPESLARVERAVFREGARWSLAPLPCARQEARDVAALFGAQRARVHLGEGARESRVKSDPDVAGARYLLFSTHALVSETMPSQSALVLSLGADGGEDGLLQAYEIDGMRLEAELVVLSACETALGQNVRGEGLLGLSRAFFHAGARRLLASQWRVADCSTAELTTELFRRLLANEGTADPAEALRRAKLKLLSRPASAHPYFWAPFVLVG